MISYGDFKKKLLGQLYPAGEAITLVQAHEGFVLEAFIDLCKWVKCLQQNHTDVHHACSTYVACGLTIFEAPYGVVDRVYTIANDSWCSRVPYEPSNYARVNNWSNRLLTGFKPPANAGMPALQQGFRYAEKSTDSTCGRSRSGIWAIHRRRLYVAPWVQSNEAVVVEWDGVKTNWTDSDLLDDTYWTPDVMAAVKLYVQWCHQRDFSFFDVASGEERVNRGDYEAARAELIYWCEQRTKEVQPKDSYEGSAMPTSDQILAEKVPDEPSATVFALIGNYGEDSQAELDVSTLVKGWSPAFIVTTGDNWFGSDLTLAALDQRVGKYYSSFLFPYLGTYGDGADGQQNFYPTIGNHDRDPDGRLSVVEQYFGLTSPYYDFVRGPVHFFVVDSGYDSDGANQEADGIAVGSVQANWLQAKLALSTAQFKVVVLHHPPFSSGDSPNNTSPLAGDNTMSYPALRWPFKDWGADLVVSGHCSHYERLSVGGLTYLVNGAGAATGTADEPSAFNDPPLETSLKRYNTKHGAIKATVDCGTLELKFYSVDAELVDTVTITK